MKIKVEGLSELLEGLQELPKATSTNVLKRALVQAAQPIERDAYRLAPHMTGRLQTSITTGTKLSRRQRGLHTKLSKVEMFVGAGALAQATLQEFGTRFQRPQPFLRPAWQSQKMRALEIVKVAIAEEIEKARKRIAAKTARRLAAAK